MRADRLVAILLLLQGRGRATAAEVAAELEVSVATARRDLEALAAAGVPVYPQRGRGGGWALVGGARTDLSGLTAPEARALALLLGPAAGTAPAVRSALRKLVRALPATFRADAEAASRAVVTDRARWGEHPPPPSPVPPDVPDAVQRAVVERRRLRLEYTDRTGRRTGRAVDPWGLVDKAGVWYLVAGTEGASPAGRRTFRLDRIAAATVLDEPAARPDLLDLARTWDEAATAVEDRRSAVTATVVTDTRYVAVLRDRFGRHATVLGTDADGRVTLRVAAHTTVGLAEQLAGWGARVDVVAPAGLRAELVRIGRELIARHGERATHR